MRVVENFECEWAKARARHRRERPNQACQILILSAPIRHPSATFGKEIALDDGACCRPSVDGRATIYERTTIRQLTR